MDQSILSEIRDKAKAHWKNDLVSVVLFGSFVKGGEYNDIDVLVVLEKIDKGRIERIPEIVAFSRTLDLRTGADILLYSCEECVSNFRNHNPLFLDIALDGVVVYDKNCFAKDMIEETRRYLKDRKIIRKGTAWFFPLKTHVAYM
jgi:predicted nucleotidyltransferase